MTRQSILIAASAVLLIVAVSLSAQYGGQPYQWSPQRYWEGRPDFSRGEARGYFIWNDPDGWHVRWTTSNGERHRYTGTIRCNGTFYYVHPVGLDPTDYFSLSSRGRIQYDTRVQHAEQDGVDFRMDMKATKVVFDLSMDGRQVPPYLVRVGATSLRPQFLPLQIDRDPANMGYWYNPAFPPR